MSAKVTRNVLFSGLRALLVWPVPFLLIPFILRKVGVGGYGTWAVFLAIMSLTSLADLGIGGTLIKHVAERHSRGDLKALSTLIATGLVLYALVALFVVVVLWLGSFHLLGWLFRGSPVPDSELYVLWRYMLAIVAVNILTVPFTSVIVGMQRMDVSNILGFFTVLFNASLTVLFLCFGWELRGLLYAGLAAATLNLFISGFLACVLLPGLSLDPLQAEWRQAKDIFSFSLRLYVTQVAVVIHNQIEKLYLALLTGVIPAGWYDVASETALKIRRLMDLMLAPVLAAASELDSKGDRRRLAELYYRSHKYLAFVGVPLVLYVAAVSRRFVEIWLGPELIVVALPLRVMVLVYFFNLMTGPGYYILIGQGFLIASFYSALLGIILNVPLSLVLIYLYGFSGAIIGTSVSLVVASAFFTWFFHRHTRNPWGRVVKEAYLKPVACSVGILALLLAISPVERLGWGGLVVHGAAFAVLYLLSLLLARFFDAFDLTQVENLLPAARFVRKIVPLA